MDNVDYSCLAPPCYALSLLCYQCHATFAQSLKLCLIQLQSSIINSQMPGNPGLPHKKHLPLSRIAQRKSRIDLSGSILYQRLRTLYQVIPPGNPFCCGYIACLTILQELNALSSKLK